MSTARFDLAGTGSMVVDLICATPRFLGVDQKVLLEAPDRAPVVRRRVGGVTLNHLGWARILGLRTALFGKQGDDAEGRFLRRGMERLGIAHSIDLSGSASSFAHVYVDSDGGRAIYMARGATGELTSDEIEAQHRGVIESAAIVSSEVSQVPLPAVRRVLELARGAGARTVLDFDLPMRDAVPTLGTEEELHAVLALADVLKASLSAVEGLVSGRDPERVAEAIARRYGTGAVVLTLEAEGAAVFADQKLSRVAAPAVEVVDTTGAGDAFLGGLLAGMHYGLDWQQALKLANGCGGCCCERPGGFPDDPEACRRRALELYADLDGEPLPIPSHAPTESASEDPVDRFLRVATRETANAAEQTDRAALRAAAELIRDAERAGGRVHLTGVGKPEHLARYAASLLSSTGTPAVFLHATEATHGSVGQLRSDDVLVAISNSGETPELLACVEAARGLGARIVAVTGGTDSGLALAADLVLPAAARDEGGPLSLAPRASFLAQTLVLAALSVELQAAKGFTRAEYHARHPRGALGERSKPR